MLDPCAECALFIFPHLTFKQSSPALLKALLISRERAAKPVSPDFGIGPLNTLSKPERNVYH